MIHDKYGKNDTMSILASDAAEEILKNILDGVGNDRDLKTRTTVDNATFSQKKDKSKKPNEMKHKLEIKLSEVFPHRRDLCDMPIVTDMRLINENNLPIEKQIECLVNDIQQINYDLENKCGIHNGFTQFIDGQSDFTKEILDAYLTSIDLTKLNLDQYIVNETIEQKKAYYDLGKSINLPKNLTKNEVDDSDEYYENEKVLNITQLDWAVAPEHIPLPDDSEDEFIDLQRDKLFLDTVAEIHASMIGDQSTIIESENNSLAPSMKDAGECKVARPVPDPEPLQELEVIEEIKEMKTKPSIKCKFRTFFTKNQLHVTI